MTRIRLALIVGFALTFAAGASVGVVASLPEKAVGGRTDHRAHFAEQLGLTAEQRSEMHRIWGETVMGRDREFRDAKRAIWQAKDEAVEGLLTEQQRGQYDAILADCELRMDEMDAQWQALIDEAVRKTKAILTPEQVKKYEQFRAARKSRHSRGSRSRPSRFRGPGGRGFPRGDRPGSSSAPADANETD